MTKPSDLALKAARSLNPACLMTADGIERMAIVIDGAIEEMRAGEPPLTATQYQLPEPFDWVSINRCPPHLGSVPGKWWIGGGTDKFPFWRSGDNQWHQDSPTHFETAMDAATAFLAAQEARCTTTV